jgi:hypothetical protein
VLGVGAGRRLAEVLGQERRPIAAEHVVGEKGLDGRHGGQARTTAFTVRDFDVRVITWLRTGGLSDEEIEAIMQLGIGGDEFHALIPEAIDQEE